MAKKGKKGGGDKLSEKKVIDLRKMAGRMGVKQTKSDGMTKNKSELVRSIRAHKK